MVTHTVDVHGRPGMPTYNIKKIRRLLKEGKAEIFRHNPFTVRLLYADRLETQPVELCIDTGGKHVGVSAKSEKHEFVHDRFDLLDDEKQRHDARRANRRSRRNGKRHRKPRFDNRRKGEDWLAPSVDNKMRQHVMIAEKIMRSLPVTSVTVEVGSFDTQLLEAVEKGLPLPEGKDYQNGPGYGFNTLREAVLYRDGHKCLICGMENVPLRVHHVGFWKDPPDHTDRLHNLAAVCVNCHTSKNHKPGGKLYGWEPDVKPLTGAAFMNVVRWRIVNCLKELNVPVRVTYGAKTKQTRIFLHLPKTHANDAYCMGDFRPKHRAHEKAFQKLRRNSRILEKFYDAVYTDVRDGSKKKGAELSCNRTKRGMPRNNPNNERIFRGEKISAGRRSIRKGRYAIRPGDIILADGKRTVSAGVNNKGKTVTFKTVKEVPVSEISPVTKKDGTKVPVEKDGVCMYAGKKRKVAYTGNKTVGLVWQGSAPVSRVKCLCHAGGWMRLKENVS